MTPVLPSQLAGKTTGSKLIILVLLAIAAFFYIRAVLPPDDGADRRQATRQPPATREGNDAAPPQANESLSSTPAIMGGPPPEQTTTHAAPPVAQRATIPSETITESVEAIAVAASPTSTTRKSGANDRLPVPEDQIEVIKRVFAPELFMSLPTQNAGN